MTRFLMLLAAVLLPTAAIAAGQVSLTSTIAVEKTVVDAAGKPQVKLEEPQVVTPGDKLLFRIVYANRSGEAANDFVVTNPLPPSVAFTGGESAGAVMSVDGGKSWGPLASLKVKGSDGAMRAATPADVTHLRWTFAKPIAAGESGELSFRAIVK